MCARQVDWNHPDFFNDGELMFQTVEATDEIAFASKAAEANPRFCRGASPRTQTQHTTLVVLYELVS